MSLLDVDPLHAGVVPPDEAPVVARTSHEDGITEWKIQEYVPERHDGIIC